MKRKGAPVSFDTKKRGNGGECSQEEDEIQNSGRSLTAFPRRILVNVLLRLSIKRISTCKCVCKTFREIISDPEFAKLHFGEAEVYPMFRTLNPTLLSRILYLVQPEHDQDFDVRCHRLCSDNCWAPNCDHPDVNMKLDSKLKLPLRNFEMVHTEKNVATVMPNPKRGTKKDNVIKVKPKDHKYNIVNSCNGLLCLSEPSRNNPVAVCNPVTGEFVNLPEVNIEFSRESKDHIDCGFGFSPVTSQYKVIRISSRYKSDAVRAEDWYDGTVAGVHTLGTGSWRSIGSAPYSIFKLAFPTYLNGALHWFCLNFKSLEFIVSFDMDKEHFRSFPPPPRQHLLISTDHRHNVSLGVLGGCLCVCDSTDVETINIWVMKDYGVKESWTRVFSIDCDCADRWPFGLYLPIKYMNGGALLMFHHPRSALIYYDPRKYGFKYFKFDGIRSKFEVIAHTPSFISLKDALLRDDVQVLNINPRCAELKLQGESKALSLVEENRNLEIESEDALDEREKWDKYWWRR